MALCQSSAHAIDWTEQERCAIIALGPWPSPWQPDASNRFSGKPEAIAFGRELFFDARLSSNGKLACATCHIPAKSFTDGRATALGLAPIPRNTQSVLNARYQRWFGWDGASDSLWSHALRPLQDKREHGMTAARIAMHIRSHPTSTKHYQSMTGKDAATESPDALMVNVAKALAAYQETLITPRAAFDAFRDAVERGDALGQAAYPPTAARGLKLFVGRGQCTLCHFGPLFSSREFADVGIRFFTASGKVDGGRYKGIKALQQSPFTRAGAWSDDTAGRETALVNHVTLHPRNIGEWKVPSLRNLTNTSPYMHNGSLKTLRGVVQHYNRIDAERLHQDGVAVLRPLGLSDAEVEDVVAFLESLSNRSAR